VDFEDSKILDTVLLTGNFGMVLNIIRRAIHSPAAVIGNITFFAVRLCVVLHMVIYAFFLCGASCFYI
jgi:hypothetical protein